MNVFATLCFYEWKKIWSNKRYLLFLISMLAFYIGVIWYQESTQGGKKISDETKIPYEAFLTETINRSDALYDVSIFQSEQSDGFSNKNLQKTKEDYEMMKGIQVHEEPSQAIGKLTQFGITDAFVLMILCVIIYLQILYEKEKSLYSVIRVTYCGRGEDGLAKLCSNWGSCLVVVLLFYTVSGLYYFLKYPVPDFRAAVQCLAPLQTTTLQVSIAGYVALFLVIKVLVMLVISQMLFFLATISTYISLPYLLMGGILAIQYRTWKMIFPTSNLLAIKYGSLYGLMNTNEFLGKYLNINLLGEPVQVRTYCIVVLIALLFITGVVSLLAYGKIRSSVLRKTRRISVPLPVGGIWSQEVYKIFIMKKGILILLFCIVVMGLYYKDTGYYVSNQEYVYQEYMAFLEGELTSEKEQFLWEEQGKYEEAMERIANVNDRYAKGELTLLQASEMNKSDEKLLYRYPMFLRAQSQYERIKEGNGKQFIYETGYRKLFHVADPSFQIVTVLYLVGMVFFLATIYPMEIISHSNKLITPTYIGRRRINGIKGVIGGIASILFTGITLAGRYAYVNHYYPMTATWTSGSNLTFLPNYMVNGTIGAVLCYVTVGLMVGSILIMLGITGLSRWLKNSVYTIVVSGILIGVLYVV